MLVGYNVLDLENVHMETKMDGVEHSVATVGIKPAPIYT